MNAADLLHKVPAKLLMLWLAGEDLRRPETPDLDPATLSANDRAIWASAIDRYSDIFKRNVVLDEDLIRVADALAMTEDAASLPESSAAVPGANITAVLKAAAPQCLDRLREISPAGPRNCHEGGP